MKFFLKTYGCSLNLSDSEVMIGLLIDAGFELAHDEADADIFIINSCVVKGPTEQKILSYLKTLKNPYIIITGCLPQTMPEKIAGYSMIGTSQITKIVEAVEETINGNTYVLLTKEKNPRLNLPRVRKNPIIEIIPISSGCLGDCSYCIVKRARGSLISYDKEEILKHFRRSINKGAKEIWITAQDTGCWGFDIRLSLPDLLEEMLSHQGKFKIRVGMMNPENLKKIIGRLLPLFKSEKLFRFLHIPVQAGSDEVLRSMRRRYTSREYIDLIDKIRQAYPDMTISTDIICGFPGETQEQFDSSIDLIKRIEPDVVNISRYWERQGTKAAEMEDKLSFEEIKTRSGRMHIAVDFALHERNKIWKDWEGDILIDEKGTGNSWIGRNYAYKQAIVEGDFVLGENVRVRVEHISNHDLRCVPLLHL